MSDEAVKVWNYKIGNKLFHPDPAIGLSNAEVVEILKLIGLQVSPEIYDQMSPMLKRHFKDTKPITIEHPAYKD